VSPRSETGRALFGTIAFLVVIALVVVAGLAFYNNRPGSTRYAAMLDTVIGLYPGADVRVLGVQVGSVDKVTPMGTEVRVDFHVNGATKVPAGADAAVVAPTVVADRYLQLSPV
jgi:ABC-type transporter Mla subunit MlaD